MKKKLESELISIAHRILKLKNNGELVQLQKEAQILYEKLSVLVFVEEHFADAKPTIGKAKADEIIEEAFKAPESEQTPEVVANPVSEEKPSQPQKETAEEIIEPEETEKAETAIEAFETPIEKEADQVIAEAEEEVSSQAESSSDNARETDIPAEENVEQPNAGKEEDSFKPSFEWAFDAKSEEKSEQSVPNEKTEEPKASGQIAFEDLLGAGYVDPVFIKPEDSEKPANIQSEQFQSEPKTDVIPITRQDDKVPVFKMNNDTAVSLNERLSKGSITVGLNDRIAFVKNLFNNSNEDYNRVLSQLLTFDTYAEAQDFIANMVKPDYNNWDGKDDYEQRFMEVVEKKFS